MEKPRAMVLRSAGINCDYETTFALKHVGFSVDLLHINELIRKEKSLLDYRLVVIPGGFSHGDYVGSGKIFANKLVNRLNHEVPKYIEAGNFLVGICNGFQVLVKAGILPGFEKNYRHQACTLTFNDSGHFQDEWITLLNVNRKLCKVVHGLHSIHCPINHGEGKFIPANERVLRKLYENDQVIFKYQHNPNGSVDHIAGICDETGRVIGIMPHPEKNFFSINDPRSTRHELPKEGEGAAFFRGLFEAVRKTK